MNFAGAFDTFEECLSRIRHVVLSLKGKRCRVHSHVSEGGHHGQNGFQGIYSHTAWWGQEVLQHEYGIGEGMTLTIMFMKIRVHSVRCDTHK